MRILFASLQYDYGHISRGESFEYVTFFKTLQAMEGVEAKFFSIDGRMNDVGRELMNQELLLAVKEYDPDLLFCFLFEDEIRKETIEYITRHTRTKTFNWFADDHWRLGIYSRYWAPVFTKVSTTDSAAMEKYRRYGIENVIKTQWAANISVFKPTIPSKSVPEVTFVGQKIGKRAKFISDIQRQGVDVAAFGQGWGNGRVSGERMVEIFSNSKINLNFVQIPFIELRKIHKIFAKLFIAKSAGRFILDLGHFGDNVTSLWAKRSLMIKGRNFEVPACGGFLLTGYADNLNKYYVPGEEIVVFDTLDDLVDKCKYYLAHEAERVRIARAGYERTIREHTYEHRLREIFKQLELE